MNQGFPWIMTIAGQDMDKDKTRHDKYKDKTGQDLKQ